MTKRFVERDNLYKMRIILIYYKLFRGNKMKKTLFLLMVMFSVFVLACGDTEETVAPTAAPTTATDMTSTVDPIRVGVTTSIIQDWVENIGKDRVVVKSIVPSGANPHDFQPGAKDVAELIDSDLVLAIGLNYEEYWLDEIIEENPQLNSLRLGEYITTIPSYTPEHDDHEGHDDHGHALSTEDPHYWFDPLRVISLVELIALTLSEIDPDGAAYYQSESTKYIAEIIEMDNYALSQLKKVTDAEEGILSDHSALAYLSDRYGVKLYLSLIHI